jgi:hypothetical protein
VTHSSSWRSGLTSDKTDNWEVSWVVSRKPFSGLFLGFSTDFSNEDDTFGFWVRDEAFKDIDKVSSIEWISTDSDNGRLSEILSGSLVNGFISQSS